MAVYYKWIKGCTTGSTLNKGAWSYVKWGSDETGATTDAMPMLIIQDGKEDKFTFDEDGVISSGVNLGYFLTNGVPAPSIISQWTFLDGIKIGSKNTITYTDNVVQLDTNLSITSKLDAKDATFETIKSTGKATLNSCEVENLTVDGGATFNKTITCIEGIESKNYCKATYFNAVSDMRAKENIEIAKYSALDIIKQLPIYTFNYKTDKEKVIGILAQDLLKAQQDLNLVSNPQATGVNSDYMSIKNDKLLFILMKAIQEQQEEILKLKEELNKLKL